MVTPMRSSQWAHPDNVWRTNMSERTMYSEWALRNTVSRDRGFCSANVSVTSS